MRKSVCVECSPVQCGPVQWSGVIAVHPSLVRSRGRFFFSGGVVLWCLDDGIKMDGYGVARQGVALCEL